mmetsp:Transcript_188/g.265  ORF Transcript_188/g.265 Transcript_188/m.265 type:complete len:86 (-) Transcript_188:83-340(-)
MVASLSVQTYNTQLIQLFSLSNEPFRMLYASHGSFISYFEEEGTPFTNNKKMMDLCFQRNKVKKVFYHSSIGLHNLLLLLLRRLR